MFEDEEVDTPVLLLRKDADVLLLDTLLLESDDTEAELFIDVLEDEVVEVDLWLCDGL